MPLPGIVTSAGNGQHGFDADAALTAAQCAGAKSMGFGFAVRYVGRTATPARGDLSGAEALRILNAGLGLMAVQHPQAPGWVATADLGTSHGSAAAAQARAIGFPDQVNLWLDLEGIAHDTAAEAVIAYCNAWCAEAASAGFLPGVYVGADCILTGDQLYWRLRTRHYWKSGSEVPAIPIRGYAMVQRIVSKDAPFGVEIDRNVALDDALGSAVRMLAPASGTG